MRLGPLDGVSSCVVSPTSPTAVVPLEGVSTGPQPAAAQRQQGCCVGMASSRAEPAGLRISSSCDASNSSSSSSRSTPAAWGRGRSHAQWLDSAPCLAASQTSPIASMCETHQGGAVRDRVWLAHARCCGKQLCLSEPHPAPNRMWHLASCTPAEPGAPDAPACACRPPHSLLPPVFSPPAPPPSPLKMHHPACALPTWPAPVCCLSVLNKTLPQQQVPARPQAQAPGPGQEAAQGQDGRRSRREARRRAHPPAQHDHRPRDDRLRGGRVQRQDIQPGGRVLGVGGRSSAMHSSDASCCCTLPSFLNLATPSMLHSSICRQHQHLLLASVGVCPLSSGAYS